jgi:PKD repeat protein
VRTSGLTASDGADYDSFGCRVVIRDNWVLVGASGHDGHGENSGAAYVYGEATSNKPPVITSGPDAVPAITFNVSATDPDNNQLAYSWDFGDGSSGVGAQPTHIYSVSGTHTATVTVCDTGGGTTTGTVAVTTGEGSSTGPGDVNGDGLVNADDLSEVISNFGRTY